MLLMSAVLATKTVDYYFGKLLAERFGLPVTLGVIAVVYGGAWLIGKSLRGGSGSGRDRDAEAERASQSDGPPRFNG